MTAHQMLAKVRQLPPLSRAALELAGMLNQPHTGNQEVVRILKQDAVLTAKLLRACNSSALARQEPISSVDQAVFLLGHAQIYQMVLAITLREPLRAPLPGYAIEAGGLWRHSLLAANAAESALAGGLDLGIDSATAFTVGLLHDIGKLITDRFMTREALVAIREHVAQGRTLVQAEREVWGTDHAEVGAGLMYLWRLPQPLVEAVARHHQPVLQPKGHLSALACLANHVAHRAAAVQLHRPVGSQESESLVLEALGLGPEALTHLVNQVSDNAEESQQLLVAC